MKKILLFCLILVTITFSQSYKVEKITGTVKTQNQTADEWVTIREGISLNNKSMLLTEKNSTVTLSGEGVRFTLLPQSIIYTSSLRKMSVDELLLALATEEIINASGKKEKGNVQSTVIYGSKVKKVENENFPYIGLGELRINGAIQLAKNGYAATSVVEAKEIFRKYPEINKNPVHRIYFADIINSLGLSEESFREYSKIMEMDLTETQKLVVLEKINKLKSELTK